MITILFSRRKKLITKRYAFCGFQQETIWLPHAHNGFFGTFIGGQKIHIKLEARVSYIITILERHLSR
jgi:hypothetical protein